MKVLYQAQELQTAALAIGKIFRVNEYESKRTESLSGEAHLDTGRWKQLELNRT